MNILLHIISESLKLLTAVRNNYILFILNSYLETLKPFFKLSSSFWFWDVIILNKCIETIYICLNMCKRNIMMVSRKIFFQKDSHQLSFINQRTTMIALQ